MGNRRGKGEGSIYRPKDGLWVGQYKVQSLEGTKTKYIYAKTRKEAATKLTKTMADRDTGMVFDSGSLSLGDYLDRWLQINRETISAGSWKQYEMVVRLHIKPELGSTKLDTVNALQIQSLYRKKLASGLSARRVLYVHVTLHKALKQAVKWHLIPCNVAQAVDPPRYTRKEIKPLSKEQVEMLLKAAKDTNLYALYVLAITTGMRQRELLGLKWEDVDLESGTLQVRRTVFEGKISAPKSSKGVRNIRLTQLAIDVLQRHQRQGEWVFSSRAGTSISCHNLHNRSWKPLLRAAGLPQRIRFHDLRHTCATLLLSKGIHPKIVQEILGHSTISITLDTYSHMLPNLQKEAVGAMEEMLSDDLPEPTPNNEG